VTKGESPGYMVWLMLMDQPGSRRMEESRICMWLFC
jgi:hypothetical protein